MAFNDIRERQVIRLGKAADLATRWIGSVGSLVVHTIFFIVSFVLPMMGIINFERMLLVLTTVVSLEAIYLAIFIQMSVNKNSQDIETIQEDVEEIQENVEEIQENVEDIQENVEDIQENVEEIQKDVDEINEEEEEEEDEEEILIERKEAEALATIQSILLNLQNEIESLKKSGNHHHKHE